MPNKPDPTREPTLAEEIVLVLYTTAGTHHPITPEEYRELKQRLTTPQSYKEVDVFYVSQPNTDNELVIPTKYIMAVGKIRRQKEESI